MLTRKEAELNSMMVSSFTHPDVMQRIGDGVKQCSQVGPNKRTRVLNKDLLAVLGPY